MKIGLLSDTHGYLDEAVFDFFAECAEIWHAGDVGDAAVLDRLEAFRPVRAVYGNIDDAALRRRLPLDQFFTVEDVPVFITHIGGYPGRYNARVRAQLDSLKPRLYLCGHSHILKVMPDLKRQLLHINPGACGHHGFHTMRTIVRFELEAGAIQQAEVVELGRRGVV